MTLELYTQIKQSINKFLYTNIAKPIFFRFDPESVHNFFTKTGVFLGKHNLTKKITSSLFNYQSPILSQTIFGIRFRNPIGLSAGFDKNAELISIMEDVGFGFVEVGSITALPNSGNSGIRLRRMPEKKSLWVNLGLNNRGVKEISSRLRKNKYKIPFGLSIAKTNCKETTISKVGMNDYLTSIKESLDIGSYITLNISCPNAYGGQPFSNPKLLDNLLKETDKLKIKKPIFIKISPDLTFSNIDKIIYLSQKHNISGFICTNLTKKHSQSKGGLSGKFLEQRANEVLEYVYRKTRNSKKKFIIIGVGGVFTAEDAYKKIKLGASLIQLITGMIYQGPATIGIINRGLVKLAKRDGYKNISDALGADVK